MIARRIFRDRRDAGRALAEKLSAYRGRDDVVVANGSVGNVTGLLGNGDGTVIGPMLETLAAAGPEERPVSPTQFHNSVHNAPAGSNGPVVHDLDGAVSLVGLTSGSLWVLHQSSADPNRVVEVAVLVVANAVSTLVRFLALRQLMAHRR